MNTHTMRRLITAAGLAFFALTVHAADGIRRETVQFGKGGNPEAPTGKTRQLQYELGKGEASWVLKLDRMFEY